MKQADFSDVQRIILHGSAWKGARHLVLGFPHDSHPLHFLHRLEKAGCWPTAAGPRAAEIGLQVSLGFSRRGLEHARVPKHVLALFAMKAPAFHAGAPLRAAEHLGASGGLPEEWEAAFGFTRMDAVLSLHGNDLTALDAAYATARQIACECKVHTQDLFPATRLPTPPGEKEPEGGAMWTHFGFRDGLSRVGIEQWTRPEDMDQWRPVSRFQPGEFLLGHPQNSGANPWIAGPDMRAWPRVIRHFFHNGSFGVLHQIEQHVEEFDQFVQECAARYRIAPGDLKAKLCGRYTDGRPLAGTTPDEDFDYAQDAKGHLCPFGSHVRRMNPRGEGPAHGIRVRPLLRRGLPYGQPTDARRGLMAQFFCASIEDQFEHLVGQWADRVPLGSADAGGARDPMFGAHQPGDGAFLIPREHPDGPHRLPGMGSFSSTVGVAYLFYPSLGTLRGISLNAPWRPPLKDEDELEQREAFP